MLHRDPRIWVCRGRVPRREDRGSCCTLLPTYDLLDVHGANTDLADGAVAYTTCTLDRLREFNPHPIAVDLRDGADVTGHVPRLDIANDLDDVADTERFRSFCR